MALYSNAVWIGAVLLELFVIYRGLRAKLFASYPLFFTYLWFVFAGEILRFTSYRWYPQSYDTVYWITQFAALLLGSAFMYELFRNILAAFPGTARIARIALTIVFGAVFVRAALILLQGGRFSWTPEVLVDLERNLRLVQAFCLIALVILFLAYAIPVERKLKGILLGYGIFVAAGVIQLTLVSMLGETIKEIWAVFQPACYLAVLLIWARTLALPQLSSLPPTVAAGLTEANPDYEEVYSSTRHRLKDSYSRLNGAVRP